MALLNAFYWMKMTTFWFKYHRRLFQRIRSVNNKSPRADSKFAPSKRETALSCNDVSHWLGANLKSALSSLVKVMTWRWTGASNYQTPWRSTTPYGVTSPQSPPVLASHPSWTPISNLIIWDRSHGLWINSQSGSTAQRLGNAEPTVLYLPNIRTFTFPILVFMTVEKCAIPSQRRVIPVG